MASGIDLVPILHRMALSAFVGVTSVSMLVAAMGRVRLRRPLLVWQRPGSILHLLWGPILFMGLVATGFGHAWFSGRSVPAAVVVGYFAGGIFWLVATWMYRTIVVTEYGLVHDLTRIHRALVWSQIVDYVEITRRSQPYFLFFYRGSDGKHCRLDLPVPQGRAAALREIVERKLKVRFAVTDDAIGEEKVLDGLDDRIDLS